MTNGSLTDARDSRFVKRWLDADSQRAQQLQTLSRLSLGVPDFTRLLQNDTAAGRPLPSAMRRLRNLVLAVLVERDLSGQADLHEVVTTISDFADFVIQNHLEALHEELVNAHGEPVGEESGTVQQLIVLGMGKLGGRELNVSSDIDLIFVYNEDGETRITAEGQRQLSNHEFFSRLGKRLIADISAVTEDGYSFRVDMALRPNGNSGPLVASMNMVEQYLMVQGREWERYAWVKARAITGREQDIALLDGIVRPFVYRRYLDFGAIHALRDMHGQIRAEVRRQESRHPERSHNVKLGRGGIREIEFLAQVFQLIRGGRDVELRDRSTRVTLAALGRKNLLTPDVVAQLLTSYSFLRNLEHRLQYLDDAQTHVLPTSQEDLALVARMMQFADADALLTALQAHRDFVAAQFDEMFSEKGNGTYDETPSGAAGTVLSEDDGMESIAAMLQGMQYDEPQELSARLHGALRSTRFQSLPVASRVRLLALLNQSIAVVARLEDGRAATLARLLDFFETISRRAAYLALLTEYPQALERVARMMNASDWAAKYLTRHPLLLDELLDDRSLEAAPDWDAFALECRRQLDAVPGDTERQMDVLRELHHAQLLRLLAQDLEGRLTVERLADHLSALADVLVGATLHAVWQTIANRHREIPRFAVIAYGKLGGKELGYASDLDVVFLYDDDDQEAPMHYAKLAQRFITWMTTHTPAGILFDVDIALRPDGASGLLVTSVDSFKKYQTQSAWVWEHQALTRARFCAGDADIGARFEAIRVEVLRKTREREALRQEILTMRQRMHDAHPNKSETFDLKHDAGGMIDIEFMVQYLVLLHAAQYPELTADIGNIALLKLCGSLGLIDEDLAGAVADAYRKFRRMQHQIRLQGADKARVEREKVDADAGHVSKLYRQVFGEGLAR